MRVFISILLAVFTITAFAQRSPLGKVIDKYSGKEGISVQEIDLKSEEFTSQFKVEGEEIEAALAQLEVLKIINCEKGSASFDKFYGKTSKALQDEAYSELMKVNSDDGEDVALYSMQLENGLVEEFVLMVKEDSGLMMIYVKGEIPMEDIGMNEVLKAFSGKEDCAPDEESGGD